MALIEIEGLSKVFYPARTFGAWIRTPWQRGRPIEALQRLSLSVEPGELFCLMGSNGAGKTTLLKILASLILPTEGSVRIDGRDLQRDGHRLRSQIGFVAGEQPGLYDRLTGRQNLEFFASLYGLSGGTARRRIGELCELLDIAAPDQRYQEYSTGTKQRIVLARALLHDPPILLLDEPTKSLDPAQTAKLHELIRDRLHGALKKTICFTTHQIHEAERLAQRLAVLHRGSIRACGRVTELTGGRSLSTLVQEWCR